MNEYRQDPEQDPGRTTSPEQIEREIERTRERMSSNIDALGDKLSPDNLKQQAKEAIAEKAQDVVANVGDQARADRLPAHGFHHREPSAGRGRGARRHLAVHAPEGQSVARYRAIGWRASPTPVPSGASRTADRASDGAWPIGPTRCATPWATRRLMPASGPASSRSACPSVRASSAAAAEGACARGEGWARGDDAQQPAGPGRRRGRDGSGARHAAARDRARAAVDGAGTRRARGSGPGTPQRVKDSAVEAGREVQETVKDEMSYRAPEVKSSLKDAAATVGQQIKESAGRVAEDAKEEIRQSRPGRGPA